MNILLHINTESELVGYEAIALGFLLASFDHHLSLSLGARCLALLNDSNSRLHGMIHSAPLYDIDTIWVDFDMAQLHTKIQPLASTKPAIITNFDSILNFDE